MGGQGSDAAGGVEQGECASARDFADGVEVARIWSVAEFGGEARGDGEEELIVVAGVEGGLEGIETFRGEELLRGGSDGGEGELAGDDACANAACVADTRQVGGEAVGEVDHGGGDFVVRQPSAEFDSCPRVTVRSQGVANRPIAGVAG